MYVIDKIAVLGDSILKGVVFDEITGKYKFLKESAVNLFCSTNKIEVSNYSKFGCTALRALKNLDGLFKNDGKNQGVLVELGGNDSDFDWDKVCAAPKAEHVANVPYEEFKRIIAQIIEKILGSGRRPFVMNLPPIDSDLYFNHISRNDPSRAAALLSFLGDKNCIYRHQELYSRAIESVARQYKLYIVNVRDAFLAVNKYTDYLCGDGIHPNARGQSVIKQVFDSTYNELVRTRVIMTPA